MGFYYLGDIRATVYRVEVFGLENINTIESVMVTLGDLEVRVALEGYAL